MMNKIGDIKGDLRQARNFAYLGKYSQSQKLFKGIIDTIQQQIFLNNIGRGELEEWRKFQSEVIAEKNSVEGLMYMISGINNNGSSYNREREIFNKSREYNDEYQRKTNNNFRTSKRGFSMDRPNNNYPPKDPDVWDPPPPMERKPPQGKRVSKNLSYAPQHQNLKNRQGTLGNTKGKKNTDGKKTFLLQRYPDGNGPDTNLIEMLEREVMDAKPKISFDDIADLDTAKGLLQEAVLLPLKMPQFFTGIRRAWKGVLMFGPPGTGKTLLAKAVAANGGTTFFNVSASSLASKWKGQSEKLVRILFEMAKFYAPSVVFFDEIDSIGGRRKEGEDESNRKVKTQLLVQMDGTTSSANQEQKFVIVLAATNRPWDLDEALRRRLEKRIYIPLPNQRGRKELVRINLNNVQLEEKMDLQFVVNKTDGFSGADITNVCRQAAYMPMRRKLKNAGGFKNIQDMKKFQEEVNVPLTKDDFLQALKNVNKSVGKQDIKKYQMWMKEFGTV